MIALVFVASAITFVALVTATLVYLKMASPNAKLEILQTFLLAGHHMKKMGFGALYHVRPHEVTPDNRAICRCVLILLILRY